jgi:hypothetical protein
MDSKELLALAERVEGAAGADRELDFDIARMLGWTQHSDEGDRVYVSKVSLWWAEPGRDWSTCSNPPAYTASLDAAMGLLSDGYLRLNVTSEGAEALASTGNWHRAATAPLAVCSVVLRALATQEK